MISFVMLLLLLLQYKRWTNSKCITKAVFSFLSAEQVDNDLLAVLLFLQQQMTIKCRS